MIAVGLGIGAAVASTPGVASADGLDFQISIDGYDLFPTTGNLATATSDMGDIAIAFGDGASASATGGTGDFAVDIGNNTGDADEADALGSGNTAIDIGNNSGVSDQVIADEGTGNTAIDIGNNSGLSDQAFAGDGDGNAAIEIGTNEGVGAFDGDNNYAEVIGPENSAADVTDGDDDIAYVLDPFGSTASSAFSGDGNYDLAAVLLTDGSATAQGADWVYDIISALGNESGTLPASFATLLTDWLSLF
jgi:hypothetical protein